MRRKEATTQAARTLVSRRIFDEAPGKARGKLPEIARCPECGASYREGRWTWESAPAGSYDHRCPACERIASDYPAGILHVEGDFASGHREELIGLVRHVEERERMQHPLKRVMAIEDEAGGFAVTTTDAKLVEAMGRALHKAYAGRLEHPPTTAEKQNLVRVRWLRD